MNDATIPDLDATGLRRFALQVGGLTALLFGVALPWLFGFAYPLWPWLAGGGLISWGLVAPTTLRPIYLVWMRCGVIVHRIVSPIVLGVIFLLVITPTACIRRLFGHDAIARGFDTSARTYRTASRARTPQSMERPF